MELFTGFSCMCTMSMVYRAVFGLLEVEQEGNLVYTCHHNFFPRANRVTKEMMFFVESYTLAINLTSGSG